jgi:hypothetical protein
MCFSMPASFAAGAVLSVAGGATVRLARRRVERPLALIPLLFGVQQLVEGAVWWSLNHHDARVNHTSTFVYMLFSHVLWPVFVPVAVLSLETVRWRRRAVGLALVVGAVVSLEGLSIVLSGPTVSRVVCSSIQYERPSHLLIALYLVATCVGALLSSHRLLRLLGAAALVLAILTLWLYLDVFVSVWCFFSAVLTVLIFVYFWSLRRSTRLPAGDARPGARRAPATRGSSPAARR